MTVGEIIAAWLKEHGYDGLCSDECGCGVDDLFPCESCFDGCQPAYKRIATEADAELIDCIVGDYVYAPTKEKI